jgi:hypothetical protein
MSHEFIEAVRDADWELALSALASEAEPLSVRCPSSSPAAWLIELNAPPNAVVECMKLCTKSERIEPDRFGLLELCVSLTNTNSNAFPTFSALLSAGVSPNTIVCGGDTLLQHAVGLNRVREVEELLRHGVDPHQMNAFGRESTSNLEGAKCSGNAAGKLAIAKFAE